GEGEQDQPQAHGPAEEPPGIAPRLAAPAPDPGPEHRRHGEGPGEEDGGGDRQVVPGRLAMTVDPPGGVGEEAPGRVVEQALLEGRPAALVVERQGPGDDEEG